MCSFRQVDERHVLSEVRLMEWSPKMDLIALATMQGEVLLHRLSWQKVWALSALGGRDKEIKIEVLSWRPDGKILAVAYETGKIVLCDVENADILHTIEIRASITAMTWVAKFTSDATKSDNEIYFYEDLSHHFLSKLPSLSKSYGSLGKQSEENVEDSKKLKDQNNLNILIVGTSNGKILLFSFGVFPSGEIDVSTEIAKNVMVELPKIKSVSISEDLSLLCVTMESKNIDGEILYSFLSYEIPLIKNKHQELQVVALKYGQIACLQGYLSSTIRAISEAWEDILLEIDSKLTNYAEEKYKMSSGSVSDDFLELLMFGTPSDVLEKFLLHDLTEKGLKKLGHSIELSYSNIQKLVLKHLQSVSQALFYHLGDLKGMAQWTERFGALGLSTDAVNQAVMSVASFLMKATEIQQVIDNSMKNFKAFFRWLYAVILRLSEEPVPPEIMKVTQQDLNFVAEFLKENFAAEWDQEKRSTFSLERVGQYLKMENLSFPPPVSQNPWVAFIENHPQLKESDLLFSHCPEKSLVQQHSEVQKSIEHAFAEPAIVLGQSMRKKYEQVLFKASTYYFIRISHYSSIQQGFIYTIFTAEPQPSMYMYVMRESLTDPSVLQAVSIYFGEINNTAIELKETMSPLSDRCKRHRILDAQFYSEDTVSVLLVEEIEGNLEQGLPVLVQLPLRTLVNDFHDININVNENLIQAIPVSVDGGLLVDKMSYRHLENMKAASFAVSGSRKVACVLFSSRRRVRLFEMDVEDEEEEETDIDENAIRPQDESMESQTLINTNTNANDADEDKENSY